MRQLPAGGVEEDFGRTAEETLFQYLSRSVRSHVSGFARASSGPGGGGGGGGGGGSEEVSVLPSQTVSSVEQGPLAILSQEETIRMAQQSDTTESYGRRVRSGLGFKD